MTADIKLTDNTIALEGAEVQNTGPSAGYSFHDRAGKGRWVWYANEGAARLWNQRNGRDVIQVHPFGAGIEMSKEGGSVDISTLRVGSLNAKVEKLEGIQVKHAGGEADLSGLITLADALVLQPRITGPDRFRTPRYALLTEHSKGGKDRLTINYLGKYTEGVRIEGNVQVTGALTQASSAVLKEDVTELSAQDSMNALNELNPVTFRYKADAQKEKRAGFIAEDAPALLTDANHDQLSAMEIVAVLTKVVKEQQRTITRLTAEVDTIKQPNQAHQGDLCASLPSSPASRAIQ